MINYNIKPPVLSPEFNNDDIRLIRNYEYEVLKDATPKEITEYLAKSTAPIKKKLEEMRKTRNKV
jgi:hypothetical protein